MPPNDAPHVVGPPAVPQCHRCLDAAMVRPTPVSGVDQGVHYWSCGECGLVWGTRDGEELASALPSKSA
jgi:hypothetical protein